MKTRAFTLIELMVVIVVVSVLSTMAITSMYGSYSSTTLAESARGLHTAMRYAQQYAVMHRRACRVVLINIDSHEEAGYRLEVETTDPSAEQAFVVLQNGAVKATTLPRGVWFAQVTINAGNAGEQQAVLFRPTGNADAAVIQLTNGQRVWSVLIEPHTGRARLVDTAVDRAPNMREDLDA